MNSQIVGNIGLYYVCYKLSLLGWNVMPTSRNTRGIDIIAYNRDCSRFIGVQVKALSKRAPVPLGKSLDGVMGDYWIVVNNVTTKPKSFISKARTPCGLCRRDESPYIGWSVQMFQTPCALGTG